MEKERKCNLDQISPEYVSGEFSCLFVHDRKTGKMVNLLTIFELVPTEQGESEITGSPESSYCDRERVDGNRTVYFTRISGLKVEQIIALYKGSANGIILDYHELKLNLTVLGGPLEMEPPGYEPLLISKASNHPFSKILPHRNSCFRVWSYLDRSGEIYTQRDGDWKSTLGSADILTERYFGFQISENAEHLGNIYLIGVDPYLRHVDLRWIFTSPAVFIRLNLRDGKSLMGGRVELSENRKGLLGLNISQEIHKERFCIDMPYLPGALTFRIFDTKSRCIHQSNIAPVNIEFNVGIVDRQVSIAHHTTKGGVEHNVQKSTSTKLVVVGDYDGVLSRLLEDRARYRKPKELEEKQQFFYFEPVPESKEKARKVVQKLLLRAKKRCIIVDPYFGADDFGYIFEIQNDSVPVKIISSAAHLKSANKFNEIPGKGSTMVARILQKFKQVISRSSKRKASKINAKLLQGTWEQWNKIYPRQKVEIRVLKGNKKSPVHDRFIITDDELYLLGSSLNEFGSRATTLFKVPSSIKMIESALDWWTDNNMTIGLKEYIES